MKFYGIYRGDKRIKRYGLHKTKDKAIGGYVLVATGRNVFVPENALEVMAQRGLSIKVAIEE